MGKINLLTSSFNGKVGELYGTKQYGNHYLKAIPFSHAPHSESQKNAFSAFGCLNRFSSGIAKVFFPYLGLKNKTMLKHNAVAQLFKPCVSGHVFNITNLAQVIKSDSSVSIELFTIDYTKNRIEARFSTSWENDRKVKSSWVCFVIDANGSIVGIANPSGQLHTMVIQKPLSQNVGYIAGAFRSDVVTGKTQLHGLQLSQKVYLKGQYLYIDGFPNADKYSIQNQILTIADPLTSVDDSELVFNF